MERGKIKMRILVLRKIMLQNYVQTYTIYINIYIYILKVQDSRKNSNLLNVQYRENSMENCVH